MVRHLHAALNEAGAGGTPDALVAAARVAIPDGHVCLMRRGAGAAALVGGLHDGSAMPLALVISLCGCAAVACSLVTRRLDRSGPAPLG